MNETKKLNVYQKVLLFLMVIMTLAFMVPYFIKNLKDWCEFDDTLYVCNEEEDKSVLSSENEEEKKTIVITTTENKSIEIRYGEKVFGPYVVKGDDSAVCKDGPFGDSLIGIVLYCGEDIRFRGGIRKDDERWLLYKEDGTGGFDDMRVDAQGNMVDPMEPSISEILSLWEGPKLFKKTSWIPWILGAILCLINSILIIFADVLFRYNLRFVIRKVEEVEPTGLEIARRYIAWTMIFVMAFICFLVGVVINGEV